VFWSHATFSLACWLGLGEILIKIYSPDYQLLNLGLIGRLTWDTVT